MKTKRHDSMPVRTLLCAALLNTTLSAPAALLNWTNAKSGNWNVAANWLPHQVPSTNDIALITNTGTYTVTLNVNPTIAGLVLGGENGTQTLATAGRTLTLNGDGFINATGSLILSGGALSGSNRLTLAGLMTWQSGAIDTNSAVSVEPSGQITIASGAKHAKFLYGNLTNRGVITWRPNGNLHIGGTLRNLPGAVFDAQIDGSAIIQSNTNGVIVNEGIFRKSAGDGNLDCQVPWRNRGKVDVQIGRLSLIADSILEAGSEFIGAGTTRLDSGTHTLNGTILSSNLVLYGAALDGQGTLSGTVTWVSGQLNETASVTVAADGALTFSSGVKYLKLIYGNLTNAGTITWQPIGSLEIGGTLHNLAGALFEAQVDNASITSASTNAQIINDGVFRKSAGRFTVFCAAPMINNGTLEILPDTLQLEGDCVNLTGTISLLGGTLRMAQPLNLAGGLLTGWGTVAADLTNGGCLRPSPLNEALTVQGHFEQTLAGRMEFELAATDAGSSQSRLIVRDSAFLRGSLGVVWDGNFAPSPGTLFPVLTYGSAQGEFCCLDHLILLGQGRRLEPVYGAADLTLATVAAPEPSSIPLKISVEDSALICWPAEFSGYELYGSTNLNPSNWALLPGVTNRFLETPPLPREKFYQLRKR